MKIHGYLILIFFLLVSACQQPINIENIEIKSGDKQFTKLGNKLLVDTCTVIIFFSPECPLSENYTLTANNLSTKYSDRSVTFIGVVSGNSYSVNEIKNFIKKFKIQFEVYNEPRGDLAELLNASITPECFVLDKKNNVVYQGAIDNWAIDLGKKRIKATEHYLDDAIQHVINNKKLSTSFVEAVGCYIE